MTNKDKRKEVLDTLSTMLGVESEDLDVDESFQEDLRMGPTEITDLIQGLASLGYDISKINMEELDTISDLFESLGIEDEI